jgi:hypothetical protein
MRRSLLHIKENVRSGGGERNRNQAIARVAEDRLGKNE